MEQQLNTDSKHKTELSIQKQQQVEREFIGRILPHPGHTIWEINKSTQEIKPATYIEKPYIMFGEKTNKEVLYREGYAYVGALKKATALKKYLEGKNGSKEITESPLTLISF